MAKADFRKPVLHVQDRVISLDHPTYFIADIAANHDGSLERAKELISLAKAAGADAAKFQHFQADKIVSKRGFESMGQVSHQAKWDKSVYQAYVDASVPWDWTESLKKHCDREGIHFFSAPYDFGAIDMLDQWMPAYKVGSGDITWHAALQRMAQKKKPIFLATGASTQTEVEQAVAAIRAANPQTELCVMQCNTNYTGSLENFKYIQLNVLKLYARLFPDAVLGLSDHTPGHATVLGAVALGARAVEKHFTYSRKGKGPDHPFSMEPADWREMVDRTRELEAALGGEEKKVEGNEKETVLIQRRCCRAARDLAAGETLRAEDVVVLRPVKPGSVIPPGLSQIVGRPLKKAVPKGEAIEWEALAGR